VEFDKILSAYKQNHTRDTANLDDLMGEIGSAYGLTTLSGYEKDLLSKALDWSMMPTSERKYTEQEKILYGTYEPLSVTLSHIVNSRSGLSFTTYSHTGLPVPVYTIGTGAEMFDGFYDNTGIYYKLAAITKIKQHKKAA
jgi:alkaline phosphatase